MRNATKCVLLIERYLKLEYKIEKFDSFVRCGSNIDLEFEILDFTN